MHLRSWQLGDFFKSRLNLKDDKKIFQVYQGFIVIAVGKMTD